MQSLQPRPGAVYSPDGNVHFAVWAPSIPSMTLRLGDQIHDMRSGGGGWFELDAKATPGTPYKFRLPDGREVPDPASRAQSGDVHDASMIVDPNAYVWRNTGWRNRPWHEAVIYELHPGIMGGFNGIRERLPYLAELGVTAVEIMPVADFPGRRNWGYDGVLPYAPDIAYGDPDELKALVDDAHGLGLMVILDVVYNHFGPDGAYLHAFARDFFDPEIHTPWGAAIDFTKLEVRSFFVENALMWLREYRFDGLRFDAVHAINPQSFLPRLASVLRGGADYPVHLVLEHEGNRASLLRTGPDGAGFDAQWADDFHHCVHVLLTEENEGYYSGFQDTVRQLARCLAEGFTYQGGVPPGRDKPRGEPSAHLPTTAFVFCLQNHDQIGNRAMGERLSALSDAQSLRAATTLLLLSPFIPMLFMGEEWGTKRPFLFFTDFHDALADAVWEGRRREFSHFSAFQNEQMRSRIPDPNAESTFHASIPDYSEASAHPYSETLALHRELLALRTARITPGIPGCRSLGAEPIGEKAVLARWRLGSGETLTLATNFAESPISLKDITGDVLFASVDAPAFCLPGRATIAYLGRAA